MRVGYREREHRLCRCVRLNKDFQSSRATQGELRAAEPRSRICFPALSGFCISLGINTCRVQAGSVKNSVTPREITHTMWSHDKTVGPKSRDRRHAKSIQRHRHLSRVAEQRMLETGGRLVSSVVDLRIHLSEFLAFRRRVDRALAEWRDRPCDRQFQFCWRVCAIHPAGDGTASSKVVRRRGDGTGRTSAQPWSPCR